MNHTIYRGDTANFRLEVKDYLGAPADITDWEFVLSVARTKGGVIAFTVPGTVDDAPNGVVLFSFVQEQVSPASRYVVVDDGPLGMVAFTMLQDDISTPDEYIVFDDGPTCTVAFTASQRANIVGKYFYDVQATTPGGDVYTIATGEIDIVQDVTQ